MSNYVSLAVLAEFHAGQLRSAGLNCLFCLSWILPVWCPLLRGRWGWRGFPPMGRVVSVSRDIPNSPWDRLESHWMSRWRHQLGRCFVRSDAGSGCVPHWEGTPGVLNSSGVSGWWILCARVGIPTIPLDQQQPGPWRSFQLLQELWIRFISGRRSRTYEYPRKNASFLAPFAYGDGIQAAPAEGLRGSRGFVENALPWVCIKSTCTQHFYLF